ncbi:hypothetical protein OG978_37870 [Streptomyces sp. NBC_01591]|uniref:hypothetical protein n=1 Tax=Streptomyces sp. NBC_01591 TaxID=2975888 RepID=UPI002DDA24FB|nr:hypothetical protein [Streptomyces sp. NBC_01591]WSD72642.1 hypothetical protein OG978_37870 [Streptomyces sp. NBC_01591]
MTAARVLVAAATAVAAVGLATPPATAGGDNGHRQNSVTVPPGPGGSVATMPEEMGVGAGLVATAAVGGGVFLVRRRKTDRAGA